MAVPSVHNNNNNLPLITFIIPQNPHGIPERKKKMVEGVLFNLAGKVLEMMGPLTLQEINLAYGDVKTELENIKNTVSIIQAVLLEKQGSTSLEMCYLMQMTCWTIYPMKIRDTK